MKNAAQHIDICRGLQKAVLQQTKLRKMVSFLHFQEYDQISSTICTLIDKGRTAPPSEGCVTIDSRTECLLVTPADSSHTFDSMVAQFD